MAGRQVWALPPVLPSARIKWTASRADLLRKGGFGADAVHLHESQSSCRGQQCGFRRQVTGGTRLPNEEELNISELPRRLHQPRV